MLTQRLTSSLSRHRMSSELMKQFRESICRLQLVPRCQLLPEFVLAMLAVVVVEGLESLWLHHVEAPKQA